MGWASGSSLMEEIVTALKSEFADDVKARKRVYKRLIKAFEDHDCDTLDEAIGTDAAYDEVYNKMYPPDRD